MPELPDVVLYVESLSRLLTAHTITGVRVRSPFVLRTFHPEIEALVGKRLSAFSRRGKRIVWQTETGPFMVVHPMIAGRFHWKKPDYPARGMNELLAIDFQIGTMVLTEVSKKKRAGVWVCESMDEVDAMDPGGLDILSADFDAFRARLAEGNRTLKRAIAEPQRFDGIGNAYGDEILHAAKLSPLKRTGQLSEAEKRRLYDAMRITLNQWIDRLGAQNGDGFPERVTAFRPEMAVHGKYNQPCPVCAAPVQRIRYAENECNYCPRCQTDGRILSDRSLARLLKDDWPKTADRGRNAARGGGRSPRPGSNDPPGAPFRYRAEEAPHRAPGGSPRPSGFPRRPAGLR